MAKQLSCHQYRAWGAFQNSAQSFTAHCLGGVVTGLTATQRSFTTVGGESEIEITWTPPSPAPQNGYQTAIGTAPLLSISAPPHVRMVSEVGVLTVTLRMLSQHYPIPTVQTTVTVLGE